MQLSARTTEALVRAGQHEASRHPWEEPERHLASAFTIALSREVGAGGTSVARVLAKRLGWPVYDQELVEPIARDCNVRPELLRHFEERPHSWLQECIEGFANTRTLSEPAFVHRLRLILWSLGAQGACIIVGRGAAHFLPEQRTLRVRLLAERADRLRFLSREMGVATDQAPRRLDEMDQARVRFIREHFGKDPNDPQNYDLVLNSSRLSVEGCADVISQVLRLLEARARLQV